MVSRLLQFRLVIKWEGHSTISKNLDGHVHFVVVVIKWWWWW